MDTKLKLGFHTFSAGLLLTAASLVFPGPAWSVAAETASGGYTPAADPMAPITVGPRDRVGKVSTTQKAAAGVVGGVLGSVLGSSSSSSKSAGPKTRRDPTRKQDYAAIAKEGGKLEAGARAQFSDDGLLVSTGIEDSPDKGTFQAVFLQSCDGQRLYPQRYEIYKLWTEQSLSVSWSKTTTTNGQVTSHETGGWTDTWSKDFGSMTVPAGEGLPEMPGTWQQLGFDRAQGGARELGAYFNISPQQLAEMGEVSLFVHTTRPGLDPVTTEPFNWLLAADESGQARVTPPDSKPADGGNTAWQNWSEQCEVVSPVLLAAAGGTAAAALAGSDSAGPGAAVSQGLPLPEGIQLVTAKGTGRTTGHVATLQVRNPTDKPIELPIGPLFIPSDGKYQRYVVPRAKPVIIAAGATQAVPIEGYCADVHRPPVPDGEPMPPVSEWIAPGESGQPIAVPARADAGPPGRALIPGTGGEIGRTVDPDAEPEVAAPLLIGAMEEIERTVVKLQESGDLQTPFSGNPEREREAVIQQTFWIYAAELTGEEYTKEDFTERLEAQHEQRTGVPIASAPPEDRERIQQGADDFWDSFELVGAEAKVIRDPEAEPEAQATGQEATPVAAQGEVDTICNRKETLDHTPKIVHVIISNSYGDEDSRKEITEGIRKSVEENEAAYTTDTPPATAYSIWGRDHIGGISSAYAKSMFLEANKQDWVWSTDPMTTQAKGTGTHTLAFTPGPECKAVVAGAAMMWMKASSSALDPLEDSIEVFRALDAVKELSVKYVTRKLPPGIDDAIEAGVDAMTDPASDTYAAANGTATLTVGGNVDTKAAGNRVVYKRVDKEDKAIVGGGETIKKAFASDVKPNALTSKLDAEAKMEAGATGNGLAKANLESLYGTILVGVCECPEAMEVKVLTDSGMFVRSDVAAELAKIAVGDMQKAAERIAKAIEDGDVDPTGENLKKQAEDELKKWGDSQGGERFKEKEAKAK